MESLPFVYVKGTHFDVGLTIGKTFKERIRCFYDGYDSLEKKFVPFYETETGRVVYNGYLEVRAYNCFKNCNRHDVTTVTRNRGPFENMLGKMGHFGGYFWLFWGCGGGPLGPGWGNNPTQM